MDGQLSKSHAVSWQVCHATRNKVLHNHTPSQSHRPSRHTIPLFLTHVLHTTVANASRHKHYHKTSARNIAKHTSAYIALTRAALLHVNQTFNIKPHPLPSGDTSDPAVPQLTSRSQALLPYSPRSGEMAHTLPFVGDYFTG